jgi:hypothetical protein
LKTSSTKLIPVIIFLVSSLNANCFDDSSDSTASSGTIIQTKKQAEYKLPLGLQEITGANRTNYKRWKGLGYSGYIRSYNQFRHLPVRYPNQPASQNLITVNGLDIFNNAVTGYQEPLLLLRLEGSPTVNTNFKIEYAFDHQMTGLFNDPYDNTDDGPSSVATRRAMAYRVLQFQASTHTSRGQFRLIAGGGVNWYRLSPFTMWNYEYRDDMFERYPWEPEGGAWGRYNKYYSDQTIARDARWGNTGTQGFILEGRNLPLGLGFSALFGKTDNSGGFQSYKVRTPKNMAAGRLEKSFGRHRIGVNYFSQFGFTTSAGKYKVRQQILTTDGRLSFDKMRIYVEAGMGRYQDSVVAKSVKVGDSTWAYAQNGVLGYNYNWDPVLNFELESFKELTFIPLKFHFFYLGKGYVNVNSAVLNTANDHAIADLTPDGVTTAVSTQRAAILDINQMSNNRIGGNLKHEDTYGKFKVLFAMGANQELENMFNSVGYWHKVNSFTRSRFGYFQTALGPYNRITSLFRRTYENIAITDTSDYKKGYNVLDFGLKYKMPFLKKDLILTTYLTYNSVQKGFKPIPTFSDKAFIRAYYQEFMTFYALHPKLTVIGFYAFEILKGNRSTELADPATGDRVAADDPDGKPIDQFGYGYGIGLDYDISGRAGLFLRNRWFEHRDKNFIKDKFKGFETTVELKIFF